MDVVRRVFEFLIFELEVSDDDSRAAEETKARDVPIKACKYMYVW